LQGPILPILAAPAYWFNGLIVLQTISQGITEAVTSSQSVTKNILEAEQTIRKTAEGVHFAHNAASKLYSVTKQLQETVQSFEVAA
jgi:hypothetical protein